MKASKQRGAVASENALATQAGLDILQIGGSAADAIIATQLCVGVIQSFMSGIGGGGFALIHKPSGDYESLDFRIAAPLTARAEMFEGKNLTVHGGMSVGTPGDLRGMEELHRSYGKLPWACCFEAAISLARDGFECNQDLHWAIRRYTLPPHAQTEPEDARSTDESWIFDYPHLSELFTQDGKIVPVGTLIKRPAYAQTLESLAQAGADAFYQGDLAQGIVDAVQKAGGLLSMQDLKDYRCRHRTPLISNFKGRRVISTPAPSSGSIVLNALNTLSHFPTTAGPGTALDAHRMIESLKFAYASRAQLGDPMFVPEMDEYQRYLVSPDCGQNNFTKVDQNKTHADPCYYNPAKTEVTSDNGTSHMVAADADGLVISLTTTITLAWGSRIIVPSSGIVLNDGLSDFAVKGAPNFFGYTPSEANYISGGKRPLSSTSPFMIEDEQGRVVYSGGAAGGSRIISSNVQHARNMLDYSMGPAEALRHPRLHHQLQPDEVVLESLHSEELQKDLEEKYGHRVRRIQRAETIACALARDPANGAYTASAEPRIQNSSGRAI